MSTELTRQERVLREAPSIDVGGRLQLERILEITDELKANVAQGDRLRERRGHEILRAIDVYGLDPSVVAKVADITDARVRQILAELG